MSGSPSPGEMGGLLAGILSLLLAIGAGIRWLFTWSDRRAARRERSRTEKLDAWQRELAERERAVEHKVQAYQQRLEEQLAELRRQNQTMADALDELRGQNQALRLAFELVATPLREIDPGHDGLVRAEKLLEAAFPLFPTIPAEMREALSKLE